MDEPELFVLADRTLNTVVQQIEPDQWRLAIPDWVPVSASAGRPDLRTLINYHAYDDIWVPDMLAGRTMAEVGADKWKDVDLLGVDPKASFARIVEAATAAAARITPEQLRQTAHLSFGDFTVQEYFWQITGFRALRAYEFAVLIGADPTLPEELVRGVWEQLLPNVEEWRSLGVFGPAVSNRRQRTAAGPAAGADRSRPRSANGAHLIGCVRGSDEFRVWFASSLRTRFDGTSFDGTHL